MSFVVCAPCEDCKYTDCVVVCPTDAFFDAGRMLVIDPERCIDCGGCVPECPAEAIYPDHGVPAGWTHFVQLNAEKARQAARTGDPVTEKQPGPGPGCGGP
jgi:ferredoxin